MAVRNETVRLELDDQFTTGMARAAAATALLNRRLTTLDSRLNAVGSNPNRTQGGLFGPIVAGLNQIPQATNQANNSLNTFSGRLGLIISAVGALGPALVPIGAVAIPAITGLANALGVVALAGGTTVIAFQGVGDALTAVNEAALEPTAANLREAETALARLSPAARELVGELQSLRPALTGIRDIAAAGLFPGLIEALDDIETRIPDVERIISRVAETTGSLFADAGESLASDEFDDFFAFLSREVPEALTTLGSAVGVVTRGLADLFIAFDPLNDDFNATILRAAEGFAMWADNLSQTEGFADFVAYVRQSGPQVAEAVGAIANALIQVVQAAAPLGGPVLAGIEAFADAVAAIAESDFGTPIAVAVGALSGFNLAASAFAATGLAAGFASLSATLSGGFGALVLTAAAGLAATVAAAGAAGTGLVLLSDHFDDANLSAQRMDNSLRALSLGRVTDDISNLGFGMDDLGESLSNAAFNDLAQLGVSFLSTADEIEQMDAALADLAQNSPGRANKAFATIQKEAEAAGLTFDELLELFPQFRAQVESTGNVVQGDFLSGLITNMQDLLPGLRDAEDALRDGADAGRDFAAALSELNGFLDRRAAFRNYQQALDDFRKGIKETGRSFDELTEKGRGNKERLDAIARGAAQVAEGMRRTERIRFLRKAAIDIREIARDLDLPREATQRVIDKLLEADGTRVKPKVDVDTEVALDKTAAAKAKLQEYGATTGTAKADVNNKPALDRLSGAEAKLREFGAASAEATVNVRDQATSIINGISNLLSNLNGRSATTTVTTNYRSVYSKVKVSGSRAGSEFATGGYISGPGSATSDSIPAWLSNGEYVVRAASVQRYGREFFDRLNAQAFSQGGVVRPSAQTLNVQFSDVNLSGALNTGSGLATLRGVARAEAQQVVLEAEQARDQRLRARVRT